MTLADTHKKIIATLLPVYPEGEATAMADWMLESMTGINRASLKIQSGFVLRDELMQKLESNLQRLLQHEPLQYVLNESWFCGMKFYVDNRVLIPRPETEELVEWIISHCRFPVDHLTILDIGSGSGCIPISLKRRIRKADVISCDVSEDALAVANQNATALGVQVDFKAIDFLNEQNWPHLPKADFIVSNPPYIPVSDQDSMSANVVDYEPHTALFVPNQDPLVFYKAIARFAQTHLKEQGMVFAEIHEDKANEVQALFNQSGFETEIKKDMQGKERMVRGWKV